VGLSPRRCILSSKVSARIGSTAPSNHLQCCGAVKQANQPAEPASIYSAPEFIRVGMDDPADPGMCEDVLADFRDLHGLFSTIRQIKRERMLF